ncbi:MAG: guanylate kinase [Candidatus Bipolaricaulota bacterium]|nr:guanylate kinase [Candidatus Bipolaricaulota bacterium]
MSSEGIVRLRRGAGRGLAFVVSGPSGAGKNSAIDRVMARVPGLSYSVSYTTRRRRAGETDGVDYRYVSRAEFDRLVACGELLEHVTYLGDEYGTSRAQVKERFAQGKDVVLNIDVEGAKTVRRQGLAEFSVVFIFFAPASLDQLGERLAERGTESEREIAARLEVAAREMEAIVLFDYLVVNEKLDQAVEELASIIVAERSRIVVAGD